MAARLLKDGQIVFAGIGIPLLAATLAQRSYAPHLTILFEGGTIGPVHRAGRAAAVHQRAALHAPLQHGAAHHRRAAAAAARLRRRRLHGRRADRPLRQPQLVLHRRCRQPQDAAARHRRRQRHLLAHQHDRGHEAREAPLRGRRRLHHLARLDQGQASRAEARPAAGRHVARRHRPRRHGLRRGDARDEGAGPADRASRASRCRTTPASSCCSTTKVETAEPPRKDELAVLRELDPERLYTA